MTQAHVNYLLSVVALLVTLYLGWQQYKAARRGERVAADIHQAVSEIHAMHVELHNFLKETHVPIHSKPLENSEAFGDEAGRISYPFRGTRSW